MKMMMISGKFFTYTGTGVKEAKEILWPSLKMKEEFLARIASLKENPSDIEIFNAAIDAKAIVEVVRMYVYGTLKMGQVNFERIRPYLVLSKGLVAIQGFDMYSNGYYPMIVPGKNTVIAQVFIVRKDGLRLLDSFEGTPFHYARNVVKATDGQFGYIYVYQKAVSSYEKIPSGVFGELVWKK